MNPIAVPLKVVRGAPVRNRVIEDLVKIATGEIKLGILIGQVP